MRLLLIHVQNPTFEFGLLLFKVSMVRKEPVVQAAEGCHRRGWRGRGVEIR